MECQSHSTRPSKIFNDMANAHDILSREKAGYNTVSEEYNPSVCIHA